MNPKMNEIQQSRSLAAVGTTPPDAFNRDLDTVSPKILIVDDDPGVVRVLATRCRRLGLDVTTAEGGLQAVLKSRNNFPDVMIVDIDMPEVGGFQVCELLLNSKMPGMNVIVLTGCRDNETSERCEAIGAYYVPKTTEAWSNIRSILADLLQLETLETDPSQSRSFLPTGTATRSGTLPAPGARVLLVDDDLGVITALRSRLEKMKATIFVADNGIDAYRTAVREEPHAVITDYLMPNGGGHYLIWRLRENKDTATLPIFVITGELETAERPTPRVEDLLGPRAATGVFRKPFLFEEIASALRTHCPILRA
ncbi:response regulator [Jiella mangrovi]|uniref:Response regulator n=1 Tax=Jiella mangrovi TaxID=2821407 RepID=A0ABS4BKU6_9HYPH|nr:response regulator [Jiella mangrovi]MBP0616806.1 response regulator [Jiella mangrovi]